MRNGNKSSGNGLITLLTTLLVVCAVAEAGIASYVGLNIRAAQQANAEIIAQQEQYREYQEKIKDDPQVTQYIGPTVRVVDSTVTQGHWEPVQPDTSNKKNTYKPAPVPKADIPDLDLEIDFGKADIVQSTPKSSVPDKPSGSTPKSPDNPSSNALVDTPKQSSEDNSQSSGVSVAPSNEDKLSGGSDSNKPSTAPSNETATAETGHTIYITKTGKRYHYDNHCNGGTYFESTLAEAERKGLTPCNKCVK